MKQLLLFSVLSLALISCSGNKEQTETAFELEDLLAVADQKVNDTIMVVGYVIHVCEHSGERCFIVGESQEISLRIEAGEAIGSFDSELIGSKLEITGILKEGMRLSHGDIAEREKNVQEKLSGGESAESCASEMNNINEMLNWMKEHDKDYYAIYYMDGLSYKKLE